MNNLCNSGRAAGFFGELQKAYPPNLSSFFCSGSCPCKASRANFPPTAEYATADFRAVGASMVTQCPNSPYTTSAVKKAIFGFLGMLEEEFRCSGICTFEKWYYFSDVNRGAPLYQCKTKLMDYIDGMCLHSDRRIEWYSIIYGVVITCGIITLLAAISAFLHACCL